MRRSSLLWSFWGAPRLCLTKPWSKRAACFRNCAEVSELAEFHRLCLSNLCELYIGCIGAGGLLCCCREALNVKGTRENDDDSAAPPSRQPEYPQRAPPRPP